MSPTRKEEHGIKLKRNRFQKTHDKWRLDCWMTTKKENHQRKKKQAE
jgi:hypothetical protein